MDGLVAPSPADVFQVSCQWPQCRATGVKLREATRCDAEDNGQSRLEVKMVRTPGLESGNNEQYVVICGYMWSCLLL